MARINLSLIFLILLFFDSANLLAQEDFSRISKISVQTGSTGPSDSVSEAPTKKGFFTKIPAWVKGDITSGGDGDQEAVTPKKEGFLKSFTNKVGNFFGGKEEEADDASKSQDQPSPSIIPPKNQATVITDLFVCPNGGSPRFEPLDVNRGDWLEALQKILSTGPTPQKNPNPTHQGVLPDPEPMDNSLLGVRMREGTLPQSCDFGFKWNENEKRCEVMDFRCPVFNGIGNSREGFGLLSRSEHEVFANNPKALFRDGYIVIVQTDSRSGKRDFRFIPSRIDYFKNTQNTSTAPGPNDVFYHGARKTYDMEVCPNGQPCYSGRIRHLFGSCTLDPQTYSPTDNSVLLSQDDPCGFKALVDPGSPRWNTPLNLTKHGPGVLMEDVAHGGIGLGRFFIFDLPVNPNFLTSLGCGNYKEFKFRELERIYGAKLSNQPDINGGNTAAMKTGPTTSTPSSPPKETVCSPGGVLPTSKVGRNLDQVFASAERVADDVLRVPPNTFVNYTSFTSQKHIFDLTGKAHGEEYFGDIMAYNISLTTTLQAILQRMFYAVQNHLYPFVDNSTIPNTAFLSSGPKTPPIVGAALYYLSRAIEELNNGGVTVYWADLKPLSPQILHYYDAKGKRIFLDKSLRGAAQRMVLFKANKLYNPEGEDISVLQNVEPVIGPLLHALLHHVFYIDGVALANQPNVPNNANPYAMSIIPNPNFNMSIKPGGYSIDMPSPPSCVGLYFQKDGNVCESPSGYLDGETCEKIMKNATQLSEIHSGESFIQLVELMALHYFPEVEDLRLQMTCSLGDLISSCTTQPVGEERCRVHIFGGPTNGYPCLKDADEAGRLGVRECPSWANDIPGQRTWVECRRDPSPRCSNQACQELRSKGTCFVKKLDSPDPGFLQGLMCDAGAGELLGQAGPLFGFPLTGSGVPLRPENYILPQEQIQNLLYLGRYEDAIFWAGQTVAPLLLLPEFSKTDSLIPNRLRLN